MYQMAQIQRDFSALLELAVSMYFLVSHPALQLTSLQNREVRAEYCWLAGPYYAGGFSCMRAILSTPVVRSIWHLAAFCERLLG